MLMFEDLWELLKDRVPALSPSGPADAELSRQILDAPLFAAASPDSGAIKECVRAGLLLLNDDMWPAHEIVQHVADQTGSFWHAIIHRQERDFGNAAYWWRMTGTHPAFEEIYDIVLHRVPEFSFHDDLRSAREWDPLAFNEVCRSGRDEELAREVQKIEMGTLLRWCASRVK